MCGVQLRMEEVVCGGSSCQLMHAVHGCGHIRTLVVAQGISSAALSIEQAVRRWASSNDGPVITQGRVCRLACAADSSPVRHSTIQRINQ
jgi:hypothetical protein